MTVPTWPFGSAAAPSGLPTAGQLGVARRDWLPLTLPRTDRAGPPRLRTLPPAEADVSQARCTQVAVIQPRPTRAPVTRSQER